MENLCRKLCVCVCVCVRISVCACEYACALHHISRCFPLLQTSLTDDLTTSKISLTSQGSDDVVTSSLLTSSRGADVDADRVSLGNLSRSDIVLAAGPPEGAEGDGGDTSPGKFREVTLTEAQQKAITGEDGGGEEGGRESGEGGERGGEGEGGEEGREGERKEGGGGRERTAASEGR